jgi:pyruvate dehydrogenase E2 component (dihydrolipoamide acetyltransferase)
MAIEKIIVPDFGDVQEITVVDVYVKPGDRVEIEDPLIALESEKAVMDIPSPAAGTVTEVSVKESDTVASGDLILLLETAGEVSPDTPAEAPAPAEAEPEAPEPPAAAEPAKAADKQEEPAPAPEPPGKPAGDFHASPSVRSYARELEVDLSLIKATGPKGRIQKEDLLNYVKLKLKAAAQPGSPAASPFSLPAPPLEDFSKYGEIETLELGRIKKISGPHLHRSWLSIPHVTHFDETDITELEKFRKQMNEEAGKDDVKFSPLVFVLKGVVATLREFQLFNCSLDPAGDKVVLKRFYNIGIAVDTPNGLVVPVVKNADRKGIREIARELGKLSSDARAGKLAIGDLQGATFTVSSLGGIGGTGFTPIVNSPQVAILGLSRSYMKPVWNGESFEPRLTLPFSLSYDHRVIDGAEAARFCRALSSNIEDLRRALL